MINMLEYTYCLFVGSLDMLLGFGLGMLTYVSFDLCPNTVNLSIPDEPYRVAPVHEHSSHFASDYLHSAFMIPSPKPCHVSMGSDGYPEFKN